MALSPRAMTKADVLGTGLAKADFNLGSVDNTADADKPVSTAQAAAIAAAVSPVQGELDALSTEFDTTKGTVDTDTVKYSGASAVSLIAAANPAIDSIVLLRSGSGLDAEDPEADGFKIVPYAAVVNPPSQVLNTSSTDYDLTNDYTVILFGANDAIDVNILAQASQAIDLNKPIEIWQVGDGTVTISADPSATLNGSAGGAVSITGRGKSATIVQTAVNVWQVSGDIGSTSDTTNPGIDATSPVDGATNVVTGIVIRITFTEAIAFGTGNIVIRDNDGGFADLYTFDVAADQGTTAGKVNIVGNVLEIYPDAALANSIEHAVRIAATCIDDLNGNSFAGIANDTTLSFTTVAASVSDVTVVTEDEFNIPAGSGTHTIDLTGYGLAQGDEVYFGTTMGHSLSGKEPSGWTSVYDQASFTDPGAYVVKKTMGATPDTSMTVGKGNWVQSAGILVLRGASATVDGVAFASGASGSPNAKELEQDVASVFRMIWGFKDTIDVTFTAPGGWTERLNINTGLFSGSGCSLVCATMATGGTAGTTVNPDAWTGSSSGDHWRAAHIAVAVAS